jgi:hypothetical protein
VVVVVEVGTAQQQPPEGQAVAELPVVKVQDPTITLVRTTVETPVWAVEEFLDRDSQVARALDLTVKPTTVIKLEAVVAQVVLDLVQKMIATKDEWAKVVQAQPTIF